MNPSNTTPQKGKSSLRCGVTLPRTSRSARSLLYDQTMNTKTIRAAELVSGMYIALGVYGPISRITSVRFTSANTSVAIETHDRDYPVYLRVNARVEIATPHQGPLTMSPITYPLFTVIVFAGSPSSVALTEAYRRSFESAKDARRYARGVVTNVRMNWQTATTYVPPCASIFEDSPSRGLERHVAEYTSRARGRFLRTFTQAQANNEQLNREAAAGALRDPGDL